MVDTVRPEDDYFHQPSNDPFWNESAWFPFHVPERQMSGFIYMNHRPNMKFSMTGVALWDPSGEEVYDSLYHDWFEFAPLNESTNTEMFDYSTPNGLTLHCIVPLKKFKMTYDRDGCQMDLAFEATMDPFNAGFPQGSEEWGPHHYEQAGRVSGRVWINGDEIAVDCGSNRDHSWGPRQYQTNPRGDFPWFNDGHGCAFQMYNVGTSPMEADPIIGTTEPHITGWIQKDGKESGIVTGSRRVIERRPDGAPSRLLIEGTDEIGRSVAAEGRVVNVLKWPGFARFFQFWSLCEWTLDTGEKYWGEAIEWFPGVQARNFLRSRRA